jgi:hypothetical protein
MNQSNHDGSAANAAAGSDHAFSKGGHHITLKKAQELGLDLSNLERQPDGSFRPRRRSDQPTDLTAVTNADSNASGSAKPERTQEVPKDRAAVVRVTQQENGVYLCKVGKVERAFPDKESCTAYLRETLGSHNLQGENLAEKNSCIVYAAD